MFLPVCWSQWTSAVIGLLGLFQPKETLIEWEGRRGSGGTARLPFPSSSVEMCRPPAAACLGDGSL